MSVVMEATYEMLHGDTVFPLLTQLDGYQGSTWNLAKDGEEEKCAYWIQLFRDHFPSLIEQSKREAADAKRNKAAHEKKCDQATAAFMTYLDELEASMAGKNYHGVLDICYAREQVLKNFEIPDPYRLAKHEQTQSALETLPSLLKEHDQLDEETLTYEIIRGVFAGNIFDMGATKTSSMFADGGSVCFHETKDQLKDRPWLVDDFNAWSKRMLEGDVHKAAIVFVDNAGPDITLGMIPFCRYLLQRGTKVIIAANSGPSLNDVIVDELEDLLDQICDFDSVICEAIEEGQLQVVGSGNVAPLIDLTKISSELADIVEQEQVDLVVLEGMGRAVESNYDARFNCESLKIAMLKDKGSADGVGGTLYDLVMRYRQAGE
ncbi:DUF89 family protein [Planctomycetota bacterium]|nr:DUF89 family protein [Planctomycetota bacterium]